MTSYYYCIDSVLKETAASVNTKTLVQVTKEPYACNGFVQDCFVLANPIHVMDLENPQSIDELSTLIKDIPLYHFNMELVLDEALAQRHRNPAILEALTDAFEGNHLPNTIDTAQSTEENITGNLRHPVLEHMDVQELSRVYIKFLMNLKRSRDDFSFRRNILGQHTERFLEQFDGFFEENKGQIQASILLAFGMRIDHDPRKPLESYVQNGQNEARKKNIREPHEMVWAWLECDSYQKRRCLDIHRIMSIPDMPRLPNWVRMDIFNFLEKEAMKQIFAENIAKADPDFNILAGINDLKRAIRLNATGQVDESLQQLLGQTLNNTNSYSGAALKFASAAEARERESHKMKLGL